MSYNYAGGVPYKAVTLAFWAGLIEILAGVFNLGFLIQFISGPVMSAFTSVVSIMVKDLSGSLSKRLMLNFFLGDYILCERLFWHQDQWKRIHYNMERIFRKHSKHSNL